jgi:hypothetical protein
VESVPLLVVSGFLSFLAPDAQGLLPTVYWSLVLSLVGATLLIILIIGVFVF